MHGGSGVVRAAYAAAILAIGLCGVPRDVAAEDAIATLHTFAENPKTPLGRLLELPDGRFIGTAAQGGAFGRGAILQYVRNAAGTLDATTLHSFNGVDGDYPTEGGLIVGVDGHFYGSTCNGGPTRRGTLFRFTATGQLTVLYTFQGTEGSCPSDALVQASDGNFYGTANGTIFRLTPGGMFTTLKLSWPSGSPINGSGLRFNPGDGHLYGLAVDDSTTPSSTVFRMDLEGTITVVHRFIQSGFRHAGSMLLDPDGSFYGIAATDNFSQTVLFQLTTAGVFTTLHAQLPKAAAGLVRRSDGTFYFKVQNQPDIFGGQGELYRVRPGTPVVRLRTFSFWDGSSPNHLIVSNDGAIYGATNEGGPSRRGVVFRLSGADTFSLQHTFGDITPLLPLSGLVEGSDGALYGTSCAGGIYNAGTIFRVAPAGALSVLHSFAYWDGVCPAAALISGADGALYGTATSSGLLGGGTLFRVTTAGAFRVLHFFTGPTWQAPNGATPFGPLFQAGDGSLFGTTLLGGDEVRGTVFRLSASGSFTRLHSFDVESSGDGALPASPLVRGPDGAIYGTTYSGGVNGQGTLFKIDGTGYSHVASFSPFSWGPIGQLQLVAGNFYGTARARNASANGWGSVFRITPTGVLTELHAFAGGDDGSHPLGGITQGPDGALFGTTYTGGPHDVGTIFRITLDGSFSQVHAFGGIDGANPFGALLRHSSGALYGTTFLGGPGGCGTVFVLTRAAAE